VIVAHFTPTLYFLIASAESMVTWSSVCTALTDVGKDEVQWQVDMIGKEDQVGEWSSATRAFLRSERNAMARTTYSISVLHTQIIILQINIQVGQDQLPTPPRQSTPNQPTIQQNKPNQQQNPISPPLPADHRIPKRATKHTSSLIFFQMILVISSPSNSTTGFLTLIF
jgi:hypothetical protein